MKKVILGIVALAAASSGWCEPFTLEKGMVVCRNKAAVEIMKEAGGYEKLPEFLIGTACFKLATEIPGQIASEDASGMIEVAPRQRRRMAEPSNLWLDRPAAPEFPG